MFLVRLHSRVAVAAAAAFTAVLAAPGEASAAGPVQTWGKGTAGGALLGAEVVVIPLGAAGVNRGWPYFVFGGLGLVGGAVGGYFVDKKFAVDTTTGTGGPAEPSLYMLAGGMALIIPAVIVSLNATAYKPPDSDRSEPASNEPAKDAPKGSPPPAATPIPGEGPAPAATSQSTIGAPPPYPRKGFENHSRYRAALAGMPHIPTPLLDVY